MATHSSVLAEKSLVDRGAWRATVHQVAESRTRLQQVTDCGPPGSSVRGISQARTLEWVAVSSSRGPPDPRVKPASPTLAEDSLPLSPLGSPRF